MSVFNHPFLAASGCFACLLPVVFVSTNRAVNSARRALHRYVKDSAPERGLRFERNLKIRGMSVLVGDGSCVARPLLLLC